MTLTKKERENVEENVMKKYPEAINILLSKERTLLSKQRTAIALAQLGLGIAAFGFLVLRFFVDAGYEGYWVVGWIFIAVSLFLFYYSFDLYRHYRKQLGKLHERRGHLDMVYVEELE
jgi:uncharacterized membrane protein YidH (DUF202 family)